MAAHSFYTFGTLLKRHRDAAGLTQAELADRAMVGVRTISDLERGVSKSPYPSTIRRLSRALSLPAVDGAEFAASARRPRTRSSQGTRPGVEGSFLGAIPTTRIVSRGEEVGRVLDALEAAESGSGRLVLLSGEPGIGKTRLAQEASVHARERGFLVATGRCYEAQSSIPYYPFLDALGALYGEAPARVRNAVSERWPYVARLLPDHFPSWDGPQYDGREESLRLQRSVTGFLREVSGEIPVAILFDDLHCADEASLNLLAHLASHTRGDRVMLVGAYRDVEVGPGHAFWRIVRELGREEIVESIEVRRLGWEDTAVLMSDRLDGSEVSAGFVDLVHHHADGNPFFTVEILKDLIERGELSHREGYWTREEIGHLTAPKTVSEAISERVSRLGSGTQRALEEASVLGDEFDVDGLMAITGIDERGVETVLEEAEASGLVQAVRDRYAFNHALTQQTLYASLSSVRRRRLHRSAAENLEKLPDQIRQKRAAEISRHFLQGSSPGRALPYALLAGVEAEAAFAPIEAEQQYRAALELATQIGHQDLIVEALERLGGLLATTVRYEEALSVLEEASGHHRARKASESASRVEATIALTHFRRGTEDEGTARLTAHLFSLDRPDTSDGTRREMAALYCALARFHFAGSRFAECSEAAARAASLSREFGDTRSLADAEMIRGSALLWLDTRDEGLWVLERAAALAEATGALETLSTTLSFLHWACILRGRYGRGQRHGERGAQIAERLGDTDALALHTSQIGLGHFYRGDWRQAQAYLARGVELTRGRSPSLFSSIPMVCLGTLRMAQGEWEEAEQILSCASEAREAQGPEFRCYVQTLLAQLDVFRGYPGAALARLEPYASSPARIRDPLTLTVLATACDDTGQLAEAEEIVNLAVTRADLMQNLVVGLEASRVHARILAANGHLEQANVTLEESLSKARSMPCPYAEGKVLRDLGTLLGAEREKASERLSSALGIFRRLGAWEEVRETERALRATGIASV